MSEDTRPVFRKTALQSKDYVPLSLRLKRTLKGNFANFCTRTVTPAKKVTTANRLPLGRLPCHSTLYSSDKACLTMKSRYVS